MARTERDACIRNGLGAYDGGPEDGAEIVIRAGRYQYIVHCTRIAGTDNYVTTNREGGQPLCFTHTQTQAGTHTDTHSRTHASTHVCMNALMHLSNKQSRTTV